jgi:hypothetical protein
LPSSNTQKADVVLGSASAIVAENASQKVGRFEIAEFSVAVVYVLKGPCSALPSTARAAEASRPVSTWHGKICAVETSRNLVFLIGLRKQLGPMKLNQAIHQKDGTTILILKQRSGKTFECLIDSADYELVKNHSWSALVNSRNTYAKTTIKGSGKRTTLLHSLLLPDAKLIDHRDGNGLNNRRSNLRPATHRQNSGNVRKIRRKTTSRYRGVSLHKCGRFLVQIRNGRERISLGLFTSEIEAARAYNRAASKIFGEFAKLNEFSSEDHKNLNSFKNSEPAIQSQPLPVSQIQLTLF